MTASYSNPRQQITMNTFLKHTLSLVTILLLIVPSQIHAQQSDYETIQDFQTGISELMNKVVTAVTTEELEELEAEIAAFEAQYSDHASLIDAAIYPESFHGSLANLQNNHQTALANVTVVEQLNEQLEVLAEEMETFRNRITTMNQEIMSLEEQIQRSEANESRQASLIRQYRLNLDRRDAFVSEFLEELVARHRNMDSATRSEISEASDRLQENPIGILKTILTEYVQLANRDVQLELPDYVAMRAQHGYFKNVWNRIGTRLTETFEPDSPVVAQQEIEGLLNMWVAAIDNSLWESLSAAFSQNGIELASFSSSSEFNSALNSYIDEAYEVSLESNREEDYQKFLNFNNFWNNTVKASWGELLTTGNILTYSQISSIDIKLSSWGAVASPTSNLMFILLIVSIAVIVGLIVLLVTKKG